MLRTTPREPTRLSRATVALAWLVAAAGAIAVLLVAASSAEGGTYRVAQCNPSLDAGRADLAFERNSDHYSSLADCGDGSGLTVRHQARRSRRERWGAWTLRAPEGAHLTALRAKVAGRAASGHVPELLIGLPGATPVAFGHAAGAVHSARWKGEGADSFEARLRCARTSGCGEGTGARVMVRRIGLRLSDELEPTAELAGPLAGTTTQRGTRALEALTADLGSGVRRIFLEVNGKPVSARRVPCQLRKRIATRLAPCPARAERVYELDTAGRAFHQGLNGIRVCADDFALTGERNRACARHRVRIDNECPVDDSPEAGTLRAHIVGGRRGPVARDRAARVVGRLVDSSGSPVAGAEVCVATRVSMPEAVERVVATPTTAADGRFEARLTPGPNREVRLAHWAGSEQVAEHYTRLRVRARPDLRVSPHRTLHNGEEVRFGVRLHGPEQAGRQIQMEVRSGGRWALLRAKHTNSQGRWSGGYRFSSTTGTRTYRFRAVVPRQQGYPYERGWSSSRSVRVSG